LESTCVSFGGIVSESYHSFFFSGQDIHLDITEQKQLEIELEIEKEKALEASKAKEIFLATMSHEIRTPLNAIIGFLRELKKQPLSDDQKKYIENSSLASSHLLSIINNVLDISKIEAGYVIRHV
jgi:signal transduction histidine kinase